MYTERSIDWLIDWFRSLVAPAGSALDERRHGDRYPLWQWDALWRWLGHVATAEHGESVENSRKSPARIAHRPRVLVSGVLVVGRAEREENGTLHQTEARLGRGRHRRGRDHPRADSRGEKWGQNASACQKVGHAQPKSRHELPILSLGGIIHSVFYIWLYFGWGGGAWC